MKQIALLLLILSLTFDVAFSQNSKSYDYEPGKTVYQPIWLMGISKDSARILADNIALTAKHKYTFDEVDESDGYLIFHYIRDGKDREETNLAIPFNVETINNTKRYLFKNFPWVEIEDIFPFWKTYIDPTAKFEDTATKYLIKRKAYTYTQPDGSTTYYNAILSKESSGWKFWVK